MSSSTSIVPTRRLISAQVAAVLKKEADAPAIGIRAEAPSDLGETLRVGDRELPVARCESVLALRERLAELDATNGPLVVVTTLEDRELGWDVLARLAKRRLFSIDPWQLVKEQFRAQYVDARIVERHPWVARALLEIPPEVVVSPAPSGFLDADTVWTFLFGQVLGLPEGRRDPESLLAWSLGSGNVQRLARLPDDYRTGLLAALEAEPVSKAIFGALSKGGETHPLAIGLVARVLFDETVSSVTAAVAAARLEPLLTEPLRQDVALGWANAAEAVLAGKISGGVEEARPWLAAADALLEEIRARELAPASRFLLSSWDERLEAFGAALGLGAGQAMEAAERIVAHALAAHSEKRVERVRMAVRLLRWLEAEETRKSSFAEAARAYRQEGGHVDWARASVWQGDGNPTLARAYETLFARASEKREAENQRFARLLAEWSRAGVFGDDPLPVESVLNRVVAPLARACPTLVVVIDGMSVAVFRELFDDVLAHGFTERVPADDTTRRAVIAALPTVTELSRTSLLCGKLVAGNSITEKEGFSSHPELAKLSRPERPPVLFHKSDLQDPGSGKLAGQLRNAIADPEHAVVGVVINAVDDHLAKGDQVRVSWNCHTIRPLEELVEAARDAERALVLVSDHGHVLERDLVYRAHEGERERWREAAGEPESDEVLLEGPRVLAGKEHRIIAPWSEKVRYAHKKNGYHGGATPQEVVIPLAVAAPASLPELEGWVEVPLEMPAWWTAEAETAPPKPAPAKPKKPKKSKKEDKRQRELFPTGEGWIERLFASETFRAQRDANKRVRLEDERIRAILLALDERGKLTRAALAQRLGVPPLRLPGILSTLRRLLNVEGYEVVALDEASDTVSLDRQLLLRQFELGGD